jgi:hypothetical protein
MCKLPPAMAYMAQKQRPFPRTHHRIVRNGEAKNKYLLKNLGRQLFDWSNQGIVSFDCLVQQSPFTRENCEFVL